MVKFNKAIAHSRLHYSAQANVFTAEQNVTGIDAIFLAIMSSSLIFGIHSTRQKSLR